MLTVQVDHWFQPLQRVLAPLRCLLCGEPGDTLDLCRDCRAGLPWNRSACTRCAAPLPVDQNADRRANGAAPRERLCGQCLQQRTPLLTRTRAPFVYAPPLDRLLPRLKFHGDLAAGALLSALMARAFDANEQPGCLVPIPLGPSRLRQRGFDQALELARPLARATGIPLQPGLLQRRHDTAPQTRLDRAQRRRNVRHAFAVSPDTEVPAHITLVDDVMTTGATLHAAACALRRAGVARVDAWVCARVP